MQCKHVPGNKNLKTNVGIEWNPGFANSISNIDIHAHNFIHINIQYFALKRSDTVTLLTRGMNKLFVQRLSTITLLIFQGVFPKLYVGRNLRG